MINLIRKYLPWEIIERFVIWILSALILGLFDLYTFRFDPRRFMNADYLSEVGILVALGLFIFAHRLLKKAKELREADTQSQSLEDKIYGYTIEKKTSDLVEFTIYENLCRRKAVFLHDAREVIQRKLARLNYKDMKAYVSGTVEEKQARRKVRKLLLLELQTTPEYVETNGESLKAKFIKITPGFMTSGKNTGNKQPVQNPSKGFKTAMGDNWANFTIPTLLVAFVIGSILTANEADVWAIVLIVSIKLLLLLFQHWSAGNYAPTWNAKTWLADLHFRKSLWERFFDWKKQKKEVETDG